MEELVMRRRIAAAGSGGETVSDIPKTLGELKSLLSASYLDDRLGVKVAHGDYATGPGIAIYRDDGKGIEVLHVIELEI